MSLESGLRRLFDADGERAYSITYPSGCLMRVRIAAPSAEPFYINLPCIIRGVRVDDLTGLADIELGQPLTADEVEPAD